LYGILTDQIDRDFETALRIATQEGLSYISLHRLWGKMVTDLTPPEYAEMLRLLERYPLPVNMICSLLFRPFPIDDIELETLEEHPRFREHIALLDRSIEIANAVSAPYIRTFACSRDMPVVNPSPRATDGGGINDTQLAIIAKALRLAVERLEGTGVQLALENCRAFFANTGGNQRRILDAVDHPDLKIIWDPANAYAAGETPMPHAYELVRDRIVDVHCKDSRVVDEETGLVESTLIGDGGAMWPDQIAALQRDGIHTLTLETKLPSLPRLQSIVHQAQDREAVVQGKE
jgi:sugar phosphate isomerase/epimerase